MNVTKEITFDAAHMLSNYDGKCRNLHGHTYKLQATVITDTDLETHMVYDFNDLKDVLLSIKNVFDHKIIFSGRLHRNSAEDALLEWAQKSHMEHLVLEDRKSTCEMIALTILESLREEIGGDANYIVKLWETPTSFVEVSTL